MPTFSQAYDAVKARLESGSLPFPLTWQNEDMEMSDAPGVFAYTEIIVEDAEFAAFGGGRGLNTQRNFCRIDIYLFAPRGQGLKVATDAAEQAATLLRSYRDTVISCFSATVKPGGDGADLKPPGMSTTVDSYYWARATVDMYFDQIG